MKLLCKLQSLKVNFVAQRSCHSSTLIVVCFKIFSPFSFISIETVKMTIKKRKYTGELINISGYSADDSEDAGSSRLIREERALNRKIGKIIKKRIARELSKLEEGNRPFGEGIKAMDSIGGIESTVPNFPREEEKTLQRRTRGGRRIKLEETKTGSDETIKVKDGGKENNCQLDEGTEKADSTNVSEKSCLQQ